MESEKVKEIKKALECCGKNNPDCDNCPYSVGDGSLCRQLEQEALTLINELESELKTHKDRITELENGIAKSMLGCEFLPECINDKLKQFAKTMRDEYAIPYHKIDETLKEFLKE